MIPTRYFRMSGLLLLIASLGAFVMACSDSGSTPTAAPAATATAPATTAATATPAAMALSGTIQVDGSSTVFPVTQAVAEEFRKEQPGVQVNVAVSGTGGGFKRFTVGETDISNASRPIKDSEAEAAASNGIEFIEMRIGTDGLSVMVHPDNDFVDCLTVGELNEIWKPGSSINNWQDVRAGFPDQRLRLYGPDTDSGTFDYFTEEINGEAQVSRADYTASADDNVLVQGIAGDRGSLGYFGYAYYQENQDSLKIVAIDDGDGCVTPEPSTIEDGSYKPLSRPLFIYVNVESIERPEVKALLTFYMDHGYDLTLEEGYVPVERSIYADNKSAALSGTASRMDGSSTPVALSGTIQVDGSSTVFPVTQAVAEEFRKEQPGVQVNVAVSGTGGGFKRFTVGETDISNASRPIKDSEAEAAASNGIEFIEMRIGTDGLSVMVHPDNDFVDCLTVGELNEIWKPGSSINNWQDVRAGFPDQRLRLYGPDTDSGTFDYFTEEINGEAQVSRADYTASADDNVLVQGIAGDRGSLGYFGYAYYQENQDSLKIVAIDDGDGCVTPEPSTIEDGSYKPLSRPLFIYVNVESIERPEVKALLTFYMDHGYDLTLEEGYVPVERSVYADNKSAAGL